MASTISSIVAVRCVVRQFETPGVSAMGDHQTGAGQILQHLGKKLFGAFGCLGEFRPAGACPRR